MYEEILGPLSSLSYQCSYEKHWGFAIWGNTKDFIFFLSRCYLGISKLDVLTHLNFIFSQCNCFLAKLLLSLYIQLMVRYFWILCSADITFSSTMEFQTKSLYNKNILLFGLSWEGFHGCLYLSFLILMCL